MSEQRISIRQRYEPTGDTFQVLQEGTVCSTHETKEKAVIAIRQTGGRVAAMWARTDFGSGPIHADFCAELLGESIGRIYRHPHGTQEGLWSWSMTAFKRTDRQRMLCHGTEESKQDAARMVEWVYTHCVEG